MPCALTSNLEYPDYIKSMLKEISAEDDELKKDCACSLKTPLTDEGCPILDENEEVGLFPFCIEKSDSVGQGTNYPVGFTLRELMNFYWKTKNITFDVNVNPPGGGLSYPITFHRYGYGAGAQANGDPAQIRHMKELVCGGAMGGGLFYYSQSQNGLLNIFNAGGGAATRYHDELFYPYIYFSTFYSINENSVHHAETIPDLFLAPDYYGNTAVVKGNIKIYGKSINVYSYPQYCSLINDDPIETSCVNYLTTAGEIFINQF